MRLVGDEHEVRVLDKLTYAGRRENLPEGTELVVGAIEDPAVVREAMEGCDAVVNFAAESHVDRSIDDQDAFARTHVIGTGILLDAARELGVGRYLQVSTDEVYGSIESGSFTETSPLDPSSPYSATKAAGDLLVSAHFHTYGLEAVICRGSNNYGPRQYPEKLIPLMVLNAIHGDSLPVYGDGRQVRNWLYVEDFCRGIHTVLDEGPPRRGLQRRRPRRVREHRGGQAGDRADRRRRVADRVRQRPPRPRPPLLARQRQDPRAARLGGARCASPRASSAPCSGTATTRSGGARSAPASTASTTKSSTAGRWADAAAAARPSSTGVVLLEPAVHGDERGFMVETYRRDPGPSSGSTSSSSSTTTRAPPRAPCAASTSRPSPARRSWSAARAARIFDVAVDLRRDSPTYGQWEGHVLDDESHRQLFVPVGFGHGFAVLSEVADVTYLLSSTYDPATESGIAWDDPDVGVEWPVAEPLLTERDKRGAHARRGRRAAVLPLASASAMASAGAHGGDREADRQLGADPGVDRGVDERVVLGGVEAAVEAAHAAVEGDLLFGRAGACRWSRP